MRTNGVYYREVPLYRNFPFIYDTQYLTWRGKNTILDYIMSFKIDLFQNRSICKFATLYDDEVYLAAYILCQLQVIFLNTTFFLLFSPNRLLRALFCEPCQFQRWKMRTYRLRLLRNRMFEVFVDIIR